MKIFGGIIVITLLGLLGCGSTRKAQEPKPEPEPSLTPTEWTAKANAERRPCNGMSGAGGTNGFDVWSVECVNGVQVFKLITEEVQKEEAKRQARKDELAAALTTRVLTKQEMHEVAMYGSSLLTRPMTPYSADGVAREFRVMLAIQQVLRAGAKHVEMPDDVNELPTEP